MSLESDTDSERRISLCIYKDIPLWWRSKQLMSLFWSLYPSTFFFLISLLPSLPRHGGHRWSEPKWEKMAAESFYKTLLQQLAGQRPEPPGAYRSVRNGNQVTACTKGKAEQWATTYCICSTPMYPVSLHFWALHRGVCVCGEAGRIDTKIQMKSMSSWLKVNDKHISGPNKCNVFFTKCIFCQKNKLWIVNLLLTILTGWLRTLCG